MNKIGIMQSPAITSNGMKGVEMGMSVANAARLASYFRNNIYSDKILAPIREYICNALDASIVSDTPKPVEVRMITEGEVTTWSVRDHGEGLSQEDVETVFGILGETRKDTCYKQVGQFGVGSHSFFAFTDSFFVDSHFQGVHTKYIASLSGNVQGVAVGQIYKIHQEPTTESGIMISADVSKNTRTFHEETTKFVEHSLPSAKIIFTAVSGEEITPIQSISSLEIDGITISQYEEPLSKWNGKSYYIRMGGVIYANQHYFPFNSATPLIMDIVIDIPIGKMSVPISRESFEDTPQNKEYLKTVENILIDLIEQDRIEAIQNRPSLGSLLNLQNISRDTAQSKYFSFNFVRMFPDSYNLWNTIEKEVYCDIPPCKNGKHLVYLFPDIKNTKSWEKRLHTVVSQLPGFVDYFKVKNTARFMGLLKSEEIDFSDVEFVDVKKLGLPKLDTVTGSKEFIVYLRSSRVGSFTADSFEEWVAPKTTIELEDEWWKNVDNIDDLNSRSITCGVSPNNYSNNYFTRSVKFHQAMVELGWLDSNSDEYRNKAEDFRRRKSESDKQESSKYNLSRVMFFVGTHPNVVNLVSKNVHKLDRLINRKKLILEENSTRAKILQTLDNYSYGSNDFTRADLRKIMTLK